MESQQQLRQKRKQLFEKINENPFIIHGSLIKTKKKCGRKTCRCENGNELHSHTYLSTTHQRKVTNSYIKPSEMEDVAQAIKNYRELMLLLNEISRVNLALLKQGKKNCSKVNKGKEIISL